MIIIQNCEVEYSAAKSEGNPKKAPFVLQTNEQIEVLRESESRSLYIRVIQRVPSFAKRNIYNKQVKVNVCVSKRHQPALLIYYAHQFANNHWELDFGFWIWELGFGPNLGWELRFVTNS